MVKKKECLPTSNCCAAASEALLAPAVSPVPWEISVVEQKEFGAYGLGPSAEQKRCRAFTWTSRAGKLMALHL